MSFRGDPQFLEGTVALKGTGMHWAPWGMSFGLWPPRVNLKSRGSESTGRDPTTRSSVGHGILEFGPNAKDD